jgi:hypothetical protein
METRSKNKTAHPGNVVKPAQRRTAAELQQEREAKAQLKAAHAEAQQQSINRAAEFERADMINEDFVDATPRPLFTPKSWPPHRNLKNSVLTSAAETSDIEMGDNHDGALFEPVAAGDSESAVESDEPSPPPKKRKAQTVQKAAVNVEQRKGVEKTAADGEKKVETAPGSDNEPLQEPKPKKMKVKMRDAINIAAKKIEANAIEGTQSKYGHMVKAIPSRRAGEGPSGKPAPKAPSQVQAVDGRRLKREGGIADNKEPNQMDINDRYSKLSS